MPVNEFETRAALFYRLNGANRAAFSVIREGKVISTGNIRFVASESLGPEIEKNKENER
jgi:hypothetical protein